MVKLCFFVFIEGPATTSEIIGHLKLGVITALGWVGVITGIRLYNHFLRSDAAPVWYSSAWVGLLCGTVASISLISWMGGSLTFRVFFVGWPLIGAMTFGWFLASAQKDVPVKTL